jgi:hypothetical protein
VKHWAAVVAIDIKRNEEKTKMGKPKWACASCGMYAGRKFSVQRHIKNIHGGNANLVSYMDYQVGRKSGFYWPSLPPTYQSKDRRQEISYLDIWKEEVLRESVRKYFRSQTKDR